LADVLSLHQKMNRDAKQHLDEIGLRYDDVLSNLSSPTTERVSECWRELKATSFVEGMFLASPLRPTIDKLEREVQKYLRYQAPTPPGSYPGWEWSRAVERQARFVYRVASIIPPSGLSRPAIEAPGVRDRTRRELANHLRKAHAALRVVLRDEHFVESLTPLINMHKLRALPDDLLSAAHCLEETPVKYPFQRNRPRKDLEDGGERDERAGFAHARELINRIADSCYRFYCYCDKKIIEDLTAYVWLDDVATFHGVKKTIREALDRKSETYHQRVSGEDRGGDYAVEPTGSGWTPAVTLEPSWLRPLLKPGAEPGGDKT
jgi:hypothetical protein